MNFFSIYHSPLGPLLLQSDGEHLTGLSMNAAIPEAETDLPVFQKTRLWLDDYFRGNHRAIDIPLSPAGTVFQQQIWTLLLAIPFGRTCTYGELARQVAKLLGKEKMSAQAVGQAVGRNPISIVIPCHRCVGAKGQMTGYAWGIDKKTWLLRHEYTEKLPNESLSDQLTGK